MPSYIGLYKEGLHYKDLLNYITIRSFNNEGRGLCIPSYDTIADKSGLSKNYISASIKRLEQAGYISVERSSKAKSSNRYSFKDVDAFCRIPYDIFDMNDMNPTQKAMLIALRVCFDSNSLEVMFNLTTCAELIGVSYRTLYPQYNSLIKKGYIEKAVKISKSGRKRKVMRLTNKVNWIYIAQDVVTTVEPPKYFELDNGSRLIL